MKRNIFQHTLFCLYNSLKINYLYKLFFYFPRHPDTKFLCLKNIFSHFLKLFFIIHLLLIGHISRKLRKISTNFSFFD